MKILAIGPHPDDIELGCFGTLAKLNQEGNEIHILVLTKGEQSGDPEEREQECKASAELINATLHFGNLKDTEISEGIDTINAIEKVVNQVNPDIIFSPSNQDTHQDHRNTSKAVVSCSRKVLEIYFYEAPSTTRNFSPNLYFDVTDTFDKKISAVKIHKSQGDKSYMAEQAIEGLANFRGFDISLNDRKVEAFEVFKMIKK